MPQHTSIYECLLSPIFVAVCFKGMMVSAVWRWRENSAETCRSYV